MQVSPDEWGQLREDVGFIKANIVVVGDHETRLRKLEKASVGRGAVRSVFWKVTTVVSTLFCGLFASGNHHI